MVAASTFNASHQTSWLYLCEENLWIVLPWPPQLTRGLGKCLIGQALKWWTEWSTNRGPRSPEGSYIMWKTLQGGGDEKSVGKNTIALRTAIVIKSKRNIFRNYSHWTLPRKNFRASHLSTHCFSLLSYHL